MGGEVVESSVETFVTCTEAMVQGCYSVKRVC